MLLKKIKILLLSLIAIFAIAAFAHATTWDFNDGTSQGWSATFNSGPGAFGWQSSVNYSGDPALGRAPAYGPVDDNTDLLGAIYGTPDSLIPGGFTIASFASPDLGGVDMSSISAQFIVSGQEQGIPSGVLVSAQIGYHITGAAGYVFGSFSNLNTTAPGVDVTPFWTETDFDFTLGAGETIDQIFVNVWVDGPTTFGGTQMWIDQVVTDDGGTGPGPGPGVIPEPGTFFLLGFGLLGVAGLGRKR